MTINENKMPQEYANDHWVFTGVTADGFFFNVFCCIPGTYLFIFWRAYLISVCIICCVFVFINEASAGGCLLLWLPRNGGREGEGTTRVACSEARK